MVSRTASPNRRSKEISKRGTMWRQTPGGGKKIETATTGKNDTEIQRSPRRKGEMTAPPLSEDEHRHPEPKAQRKTSNMERREGNPGSPEATKHRRRHVDQQELGRPSERQRQRHESPSRSRNNMKPKKNGSESPRSRSRSRNRRQETRSRSRSAKPLRESEIKVTSQAQNNMRSNKESHKRTKVHSSNMSSPSNEHTTRNINRVNKNEKKGQLKAFIGETDRENQKVAGKASSTRNLKNRVPKEKSKATNRRSSWNPFQRTKTQQKTKTFTVVAPKKPSRSKSLPPMRGSSPEYESRRQKEEIWRSLKEVEASSLTPSADQSISGSVPPLPPIVERIVSQPEGQVTDMLADEVVRPSSLIDPKGSSDLGIEEDRTARDAEHMHEFLTSWGHLKAAAGDVAKSAQCGAIDSTLSPQIMERETVVPPIVNDALATEPGAGHAESELVTLKKRSSSSLVAAGDQQKTSEGEEENCVAVPPKQATQIREKKNREAINRKNSPSTKSSAKMIQKAGRRTRSRMSLFRRKRSKNDKPHIQAEDRKNDDDSCSAYGHEPTGDQHKKGDYVSSEISEEISQPQDSVKPFESPAPTSDHPVRSVVAQEQETTVAWDSSFLGDVTSTIEYGATVFYTKVDEVIDKSQKCSVDDTIPSQMIKEPECLVFESMGEMVESPSVLSECHGTNGPSFAPALEKSFPPSRDQRDVFVESPSLSKDNAVLDRYTSYGSIGEEIREVAKAERASISIPENVVLDRYAFAGPIEEELREESQAERAPMSDHAKQKDEYSTIVDDSFKDMSSALEEVASLFYTKIDNALDAAYPGASKAAC